MSDKTKIMNKTPSGWVEIMTEEDLKYIKDELAAIRGYVMLNYAFIIITVMLIVWFG